LRKVFKRSSMWRSALPIQNMHCVASKKIVLLGHKVQ
jgi:hypothetical protein